MRTVSVLTHHDSHPLIILPGSYSHALTCKQGLLGRSSKQKNPSGPITATRQKGRSNEDEDVDSLLTFFFLLFIPLTAFPLPPSACNNLSQENRKLLSEVVSIYIPLSYLLPILSRRSAN